MVKLAKEAGISPTSMRRLVRSNLHLTPYKLQRRQMLTEKTKLKRLERSKALLRKLHAGTLKNLVFSDEKLSTVQMKYNPQNDRILAVSKENIPPDVRTAYKSQMPATVIIWAAGAEDGSKSP